MLEHQNILWNNKQDVSDHLVDTVSVLYHPESSVFSQKDHLAELT